jgi:uncharacterized membrane protein YGL010W
MRTALDLLSRYAAYHRDQRNIATHIVGIPLIVFSIGVLLARPSFGWLGLALSPAWLLWGATAGWYLIRGRFVLGLAVSLLNALLVALAQPLAALSTAAWLAWGTGCFVLGWLVQFAGHWYEGRRPAFFDERVGLLVGPMFVTAEALFALGWNPPLLREIERRVGPTHLRDLASMHPS